MNTGNIKSYAPKARNAFIAAMTKQATKYGITDKGIEPMEQRGDLALIGDNAFPKTVARPRNALTKLVEQQGFTQTMEQAAYSWFNRLCAIRFMELKGYLEHGRRVLSHPADPQGFQILEDCLEIDISGMDKQRIQELKLDGTQDETLYRELLFAQCHALHETMPFLFEALDDATELLLPDNLTKTDSLIRELVRAIPEEDWAQVEIIGWLYQFYISEKKDQVIGKVVKSEDIPAATQLFTPNWIVQYLVQNSVGRQWLQTYPDSPLKDKMPYYVEPAEQTEEVQAQLTAITPDSIDPESIKVLDPACGSGHILVEAYKVLKAIYEERGYRSRDIPRLILENNLFGLDIDDRAGQLAGFALMMLAREDDRRIFSRDLKLNVLSLQETTHLDLKSIWQALNLSGDWQRGSSQSMFEPEQVELSSSNADVRYQLLQRTLDRFSQAKIFGSLIDVPAEEETSLKDLLNELEQLEKSGDSMQKPTAELLIPYVKQAWILAHRYDAVLANPPYLVSNNFNKELKAGLKKSGYKVTRSDLYVVFIERLLKLVNLTGDVSMITMQSWMFTDSYDGLRLRLLNENSFDSLVHLGPGAFESIGGEIVSTVMFVLNNSKHNGYISSFIRLADVRRGEKQKEFNNKSRLFNLNQDLMKLVDSSPIVFWKGDYLANLYQENPPIGESGYIREGIHTGDNTKYVRSWWEVDFGRLSTTCESVDDIDANNAKWVPYNKGGGCVRWYGNYEFILAFDAHTREEMKSLKSHVRPSQSLYFKEGATWSDIGTKGFGVKYYPKGFLFDQKGPACVSEKLLELISVLNSTPFTHIAETLMPTVTYRCGTVSGIPKPNINGYEVIGDLTRKAISIARDDDEEQELSWGFKRFYVKAENRLLRESLNDYLVGASDRIARLLEIEESNNQLWCEAYKIDSSLVPKASVKNIGLNSNPAYRYQGLFNKKYTMEQVRDVHSSDIVSELVSYSVGNMMGRYSLDREGLVYAHAGNHGFAELVAEGYYESFPADDDGIIPLNDQEWFPDDATNRFREFIKTVWGEDHLLENLDFVAESLCLNAVKPKRGESALDTIRRYLSTQFFKDHLKTYKKRPIYWLFSSGKQKAFECLVYLHRYNEGTLARMRTEYVIPLTAKLNTYVDKLEQDKEASSSAAEIKRLEKEITKLHKQQAELATFDEKLRHYADQRIALDLDDGVKVNYGKFGDLLAEVKAITGKKPE